MKRILLILCALLIALPAQGIGISTSRESGTDVTTVKFGDGQGVNEFTTAIHSCPTMAVSFYQSTTAVVSLYATSPVDDTLAEIEAATLLQQFTATTAAPVVFQPGSHSVRFVVDTVETVGKSMAKVWCLNMVGSAEAILQTAQDNWQTLHMFIGTGTAAVTATVGAYAQIEIGAVVDFDVYGGNGFTLSADTHMVCNFTDQTLTAFGIGHFDIDQIASGNRELTLRFGSRVGEGPLVDGDEIDPGIHEVLTFASAGTIASTKMLQGTQVPPGVCFGMMVSRTDGSGGGDNDYQVTGGGLLINARTPLS